MLKFRAWRARIVANNPRLFSLIARIGWGTHAEPPAYHLVRWTFLRALGLIYFIAFVSLWVQIIGLVGTNGILPAGPIMESMRQQAAQQKMGWDRYHLLPTFCWFKASDKFLQFQCGAGAMLAILLIIGIAPAPCLFLLWLIYLSLTTVCFTFLSFQWDNLLLETGLLAIFFAPVQVLPRIHNVAPPSRAVLLLLRWLLFRLMFQSGCVKLLSHDVAWWNLTALSVHYETQPLPTWLGWYAHQLPLWFQKTSTAAMFFIELVIPFLVFGPRRFRQVACAAFVTLQVLIMLTGNYCFFNLLTIALCVLLLDDSVLERILPKAFRRINSPLANDKPVARAVPPHPGPLPQGEGESQSDRRTIRSRGPAQPLETIPPLPGSPLPSDGRGVRGEGSGSGEGRGEGERANHFCKTVQTAEALRIETLLRRLLIALPLSLIVLTTSLLEFSGMFRASIPWPRPVLALYEWLAPFRSFNGYGLFAVMTTNRNEIVIEGSNDGITWLEYEFKYKPGDVKRRPRFVEPHQPRLDWQMWFAALGSYQNNRWFVNFCIRLLEGDSQVLALLQRNPFPTAPPRHVRAVLYQYHFTDLATRRKTGAWWRREVQRLYLPPISRKQDQ